MSGDNDEVVKKDEDEAEAKDASKSEEPKAEEPKDEAKAEEPKAEPKDEAKAEEPAEESKADSAEDSNPDGPGAEDSKAEAKAEEEDEGADAAEARAEKADDGHGHGLTEAEAKAEVRADRHAAAAEAHGEPLVEDDRPKNGIIGVTIVTTLAAVILSVLGVNEIYHSTFNSEVQEKVLGRTSSELRELRAEEKGKLGRYQWVSKKDGVVRIPVDRAIELTIAEYRERAKKAAEAPKPAAPAPEGTAAPDAPKPDGSAVPDAPKVPPAPAPDAPKEH